MTDAAAKPKAARIQITFTPVPQIPDEDPTIVADNPQAVARSP